MSGSAITAAAISSVGIGNPKKKRAESPRRVRSAMIPVFSSMAVSVVSVALVAAVLPVGAAVVAVVAEVAAP